MIVEEFYIDGQQVDIKDVSIVRSYKSPYFSDVSQILLDSTYTIKLPQTERNKAIMKYLHEADMNTDFPYTIHTADYIVDGMQIIRNGEVKVLGDFELQVVYGINREKYLPLKETKLNEITPNGTTILESDWLINWTKSTMQPTGTAKWKYLESISGKRTSDAYIIGGVIQDKVIIPEPYLGNEKEMTQHPFISFSNILDLINANYGVLIDFTDLKSRITNKGLILSGIESNKSLISEEYFGQQIHGDGDNLGIKAGLIFSQDTKYFFSVRYYNAKTSAIYINKQLVLSTETTKIRIQTTFSLYYIYKDGANYFPSNTGSLFLQKVGLNWSEVGIIEVFTPTLISDYDIGGGVIRKKHDYVIDTEFEASVDEFYSINVSITGQQDAFFYFIGEIDPEVGYISPAYSLTIKAKSFYNIRTEDISTSTGVYDCLANLPKLTHMEFIQQMFMHTCGFAGYDINGDLKITFLDDFKANLTAGTIYDWSGRIGNTKNSKYQFNSNAQKNYIKFKNDKDLKDRSEYLTVNDKTIESEKDLYNLLFDSPLGIEAATSEYVLYEQSVKKAGLTGVTFENKYVGDKWECAFVEDVGGTAKNLNITDGNYEIYQKLINRPIVKEVSVLLDFYESANIDFTKPVYIEEWGKYCMLLELTAPNKGLCEAKLLLINQTL